MSERILIIDDDVALQRVLELDLERNDYHVVTASDGVEGLRLFEAESPKLIILDISMPLIDGWEVCRRIRAQSDVPIMMMTAHAVTEEDIAHGLNMGADEYMIKPLREMEFHARINALLRRARLTDHAPDAPRTYADHYLDVDMNSRHVSVDGEEIRLTPTEFNLLALFIQRQGQVLSFTDILQNVWGPEYHHEHHYPRIYVSHLRKKIEPDYKKPTYIHNEYGVGYIFNGQTA